ncbi:MAG: SLBB domain-containing protein [Azospirillaceae bacterium]|nr:SLBB domain-containing protein [Azospirillaceae bacterium]
MPKMWTLRIAVLFSGLVCAVASSAADNAGYRLVPADVISIKVVAVPDLSTQVRVDTDGSISFPFAGRLVVGGLTPDEVGQRIRAALLHGQVVSDPQVVVTVLNFGTQAFVLGEVTQPGAFPLDRPTTVTQILARAGGLKPDAANTVDLRHVAPSGVVVSHIDLDAVVAGADATDPALQNGDEVFVAESPVYYLYGYVNRPGVYQLKHKMTVQQALAAGGGVSDMGSDGRIRIKRASAPGTVEEISVSLDDEILPRDTVVVHERIF